MITLENYNQYLEYFLKKYSIEFCKKSDVPKLIYFIDEYWKKNHSLVLSKKLLDWQHYDNIQGCYNFVIANSKKTLETHALIGFIKSSQYDPSITNYMTWAAIWKNRDDVGLPGIGMAIFLYLWSNVVRKYFGVIGISDVAMQIYDKLGFIKTGLTTQWYMLNSSMRVYSLVGNYNSSPKTNPVARCDDGRFECCDLSSYENLNEDLLKLIPPYKSKEYFVNRYFKHPIYQYHATKINDEHEITRAIFFWRICEHENAKCIRIVDYFGHYDAMCGNCNNFQALMNQYDAEFIDFINVGINHEYFEKAGFIDRSTNDIIVANYFEPFLLQNVDTRYAWYSEDGSEPLFFKGDADQDRPSIIKEEKDD